MTIDHRVQLADIQRPIALFAQGLAGRYLHLRPVQAGARVRGAERASAVLEGAAIELPISIADFESRAYNVGAYRIAVLRQIGYLTDGTVDFSLNVARALMPIPMPLVRISPKASELDSFFAHWSRPALLRRVFQTLEAFRIDGLIRRRYPGARADLDRVRGKALAARPLPDEMNAFSAALEALLRYTLGGARSALTEELARLADSVQIEGADVYSSARAAIAVCTVLDAHLRSRAVNASQPAVPVEAPESGSDYIASPDELDGLGLDFPGELIPQAALGQRRGGRIGHLGSIGTTVLTSGVPNAEDSQSRQPGLMNSSRAAAGGRASADNGVRSYFYDEWDYHTRSYLRAWCRLYEQKLRGDNFAFINDVHRRHALLAQQVRRQFSVIRPELWHRVRRTADGDELELDGVIEAVIDRRIAGASDSKLYIRRDRALRDVAAAFLVDMSASTGFPLPDPQPPDMSAPTEYAPYLYGGIGDVPKPASEAKRRVIDVAKDALALMCEALQRLGDSCAIYGFSGDGREHVEFHIAKDFADKLSLQTWAALAAMEPLRSTRMGPAIRHAVAKLLRQSANMKVLIIVSDGYPQDHDYGPDRKDENYGIEDTACALREAECAGVVAFCVTIDPAGHDYLRRMCLDSHYMVIDDVMALPRELTKIYRTLTA